MRTPLPTAIAVAVLALPAAAHSQSNGPEQRTIGVTGTATASAPNDIARFSFSVQVQRRTSSGALGASSLRTRRVIRALRAAGIAEADIQTEVVRLSRVVRRERRGSPGRVVGYRASNTVRATLRDLRAAGAVVDAAVRAGATGVDGPDFARSNPEELYDRALASAFDRARAKARALAARAGVALGPVLSIREGAELEGEALAQDEAQAAPSPRRRRPVPLRPGRARVEASVSVVFAIS